MATKKVADVKLTWKKSVSANISKVVITTNIDGTETTTELDANVEEFMIVVDAGKSASFRIDTYNDDNLVTSSITYSFTLDSLESPQPATELFHEITAVRDVDVPDDGTGDGGSPAPVGATAKRK